MRTIQTAGRLEVQVSAQDSLALVALYSSTGGSEWTSNDGWLTAPVSEWYGVTVADGRVAEVDPGGNNLAGPLPAELGNLSQLQYLNLNGNELEGPIPQELGDCVELLDLNLGGNHLSGALPATLTQHTRLKRIWMYRNALIRLPDLSVIDSLLDLRVAENRLTFEDLQPNVRISKFQYAPQADFWMARDTLLQEGDPFSIG